MTQPRPVRPAEIVAYLRAAGWEVLDDTYDGAALWMFGTQWLEAAL